MPVVLVKAGEARKVKRARTSAIMSAPVEGWMRRWSAERKGMELERETSSKGESVGQHLVD